MGEMRGSALIGIQRIENVVSSAIKQMEFEQERSEPIINRLQDTGDLIWFITILTATFVLCISLVLSLGLFLGIIHAEYAAKLAFIYGGIFIAIGSFGLALFATAILLVGSHAEVFLCRPMFNAPSYQVLEKLFDKPGWVYENETVNGIINDSFHLSGIEETNSMNVSLASALDKCEQNQATFSVFHFEHIANLSKILDIQEYNKLEEEIEVKQSNLYMLQFNSYEQYLK